MAARRKLAPTRGRIIGAELYDVFVDLVDGDDFVYVSGLSSTKALILARELLGGDQVISRFLSETEMRYYPLTNVKSITVRPSVKVADKPVEE